MSLNSLNPFISSNSLPSLDSTSTVGAGSNTASADSSNSTPNGEQFSVFFERMMHPAFNPKNTSRPPAPQDQSAHPQVQGSNANSLTPSSIPSDPGLSGSSTWASTQALLDSQSQAFSFSQSYLGVSSQSFLDNNESALSSASSFVGDGNSSSSSQLNDRLDTHASNVSVNDKVTQDSSSNAKAQDDTRAHDDARSKDASASKDTATASAQAQSANESQDSTQANNADQASTADKAKALTDAQKLQLANQSLLTQRLPSGTPEVLHPAALKTKNAGNLKGNDSELSTIALGPNSQIVTSAKNPPTEKSLSEFAKSMGFTKTAIAKLFGAEDAAQSGATTAATQSVLSSGLLAPAPNDPNALAAGTTLTASALSQSTLALNTPPPLEGAGAAGMTSGTPMNPLSQLPTLSSNTISVGQTPSIDPALDAAAALTGTALPGATAATLLNPMSGTLNANLVSANTLTGTTNANLGDLNELMMQSGATLKSGSVNFSSTLSALSQAGAATSSPSTLSVLNMTGSELTGSAIEALQSEFNKLTNTAHLSSSEGTDTSAFGLSLTPDSSTLNAGLGLAGAIDLGANTGGNASNMNQSNADASSQLNPNGTTNVGNMADTYEKLSNQLTAELSRRMNEQISQGQWKMKFALKPSSLGAVDVQIEMKDGKLAANFQADNALTQSLLQHGSNQLKDNLKGLGLTQTDVQVGQNQTQSGGGQNAGSNFAGQNPFAQMTNTQAAKSSNAQDSTSPVDVSIKATSTDGNLDLFA